MVCASRTFLNTVNGINVCFFSLFLDVYWPVHGLRQIIVTQAERVSPDKLFKSMVLYDFQNHFDLPQLQISCIVNLKKIGKRRKSWFSFTFYLPFCSFHVCIHVHICPKIRFLSLLLVHEALVRF